MIKHRPAMTQQMARWRRRQVKLKGKLLPAPIVTYREREEYAQLEANYAAYEPRANPDPEQILIAADRSATIEQQLDKRLPARLALLVRLRYGLGDYPAHTLAQVGEQFGVCRERIRRMERQALNKLRAPWVAPLLDNPYYGRRHGKAQCHLYVPIWKRQELAAARAVIEAERAEKLKQERELSQRQRWFSPFSLYPAEVAMIDDAAASYSR